MDKTPVLLEVEDLSVDFESRGSRANAVDAVSIAVSAGETLAIVGESGSGKSVTSLAIMGLIRPPGHVRSGSVRLTGKDILRLTDRHRRQYLGKEISMIFQEPTESLNPVVTIGRQIEEVLKIHSDLNRSQRQARLQELMRTVGLPQPDKILHSRPHQLSGGMNQRVMIAMAIACNPSLLIADEPTTALDVTVQQQILSLLHSLQQQNNMGMIFITHDLSVVSAIADKIVVMYAGQVVEECSNRDLFQQAMHPYTEALLKSLPENYQKSDKRMVSIAGMPPVPGIVLPGCKFQPRCSYARPQCRTARPTLNIVEPGQLNDSGQRTVRCFFPLAAGHAGAHPK